MKLNQLIYEELGEGPKFRRDNPGGDWLRNKKDRTIEGGRLKDLDYFTLPEEDRPYNKFGVVTGYISKGNIKIPTEKLKYIKGLRGEQHNRREKSLEWLRKNMKVKNGKVYLDNEEYAPFIMVDQDGVPWVNEGNHRIFVAAEQNIPEIEVEVRWYNGGEDVDGPFSPEALGVQ